MKRRGAKRRVDESNGDQPKGEQWNQIETSANEEGTWRTIADQPVRTGHKC